MERYLRIYMIPFVWIDVYIAGSFHFDLMRESLNFLILHFDWQQAKSNQWTTFTGSMKCMSWMMAFVLIRSHWPNKKKCHWTKWFFYDLSFENLGKKYCSKNSISALKWIVRCQKNIVKILDNAFNSSIYAT